MSRILSPATARSFRHLSASSPYSTAVRQEDAQSGCPVMDHQKLKPFDAIPGPKGHVIIGTLWDYLKKDGFRFNKMFKVTGWMVFHNQYMVVKDPPDDAMQTRAQEYGPIYKETIANRTSVIVSDPEEYAKVIRVDGRFPHRIEMEPLAHYRRSRNLTLGAVSSQGEEWHRHRSVLSKKMLRPQEVVAYCRPMNDVADDFIDHLKKLRTSDGLIPDIEMQFFRWALESIGMVLFEDHIGCLRDPPDTDTEQYLHHLVGFFSLMQPLMYNVPIYKLYPTPTWRKYRHHADEVLRIGQKFVDRRAEALTAEAQRAVPERDYEAMLTYLLTQESLTPEEVNSHAIDMMTGGVETTSNASMWTLLCLSRTPAAQDTLYRELTEVLPEGAPITADSLQRLPYLKACLKETFRLYPVTFATSRIIAKDIELGGFYVPAGTHVQANLYGMGHDPELFPEPEIFRPERWLRGTDDSAKALANLPWGHGARMCLGRRIAEQEIYMAVAKVVQNFSLTFRAPLPEPVLKTVMTPDRPVTIVFTPRTP